MKQQNKRKVKYCDFNCKYADFPKNKFMDGSASCQTFQAVWCKKLKRHILKNDICKIKEDLDE
jgi:hypothetical protein